MRIFLPNTNSIEDLIKKIRPSKKCIELQGLFQSKTKKYLGLFTVHKFLAFFRPFVYNSLAYEIYLESRHLGLYHDRLPTLSHYL